MNSDMLDDYSDDDFPDEEEESVVSDSDISVFIQEDHQAGNGIPCRDYNHEGCPRGALCKYRHAADCKSVRDKLGQNVCIYYLVGICNFGEKCYYAHSKECLGEDTIWRDPNLAKEYVDATAEIRHYVREQEKAEQALRQLLTGGGGGGKRGGPGGKGKRKGKGKDKDKDKGKGKGKRKGKGDAQKRSAEYWEKLAMHYSASTEEELDERAMNCGFTNDETMELLSQGVKPWDDDADDVMDVLRGFGDYY